MALIDKLEHWFPKWAIKRAQAKSLKRYYDAADNGQYWKNVSQGGNQSADLITTQANSQLRAIARTLDENSDLASGVLDTLVKKIVGEELKLIPAVTSRTGKPLKTLNKEIERLWFDFSQSPETTRELSMAETQRVVCRTWLRDGELLIHHVRGTNRISARTAVAYAMELLEADYLPYYQQSSSPTLVNTQNIINGVEKNAWGQPVAYHVYKQHPGAVTYNTIDQTETKRVLARDMLHLKYSKRLRQTRGVPIITTVLRRLEDIKDYEESERIAARLVSSFGMAITKSTDFAQVTSDSNGQRNLTMQAGMIFDDLLPGESLTPIGPGDRPNPELVNFRNAQLKAVAAGTGTNYSNIARDYNGTYSSQRQEMVESKIDYDILRTQFINDFLNPIYREFIGMAITQGLLKVPKSLEEATLLSPQWSRPATPWIDPKKEIEAAVLMIDNEIASRAYVQRQYGIDPVATALEIAEQKPLEKDAMQKPAPDEQPENPDNTDETTDEEEAA